MREMMTETLLSQRKDPGARADIALSLIFREVRAARDTRSFAAMLLSAAAQDPKLQMGILQFVDVLPTLASSEDIYEHYRQFVVPYIASLAAPLRFGAKLGELPLFRPLAMRTLLWLVHKKVAPYFIISDEHALLGVIRRFAREGTETSVDFLGELVVSYKEADEYLSKYVSAMRRHGNKEKPFHVSVKFSALYPFLAPENHDESVRRVGEKFACLLSVAQKTNSFVTVDAELHSTWGIIEEAFERTILSSEFRMVENVGIALQSYKKNAMAIAHRLVALAKERGTAFSVRLIKGAYLETERALALQKGWPSPVWSEKGETDRSFDGINAYLMGEWGHVFVSPATHNPENILYAENLAREFHIMGDSRFVFQVLYGLGEPIRRVLRKRGLRVLMYAPVGNLLQGMAYLARRILENTSNQNFLSTLVR